MLLKLLLTIFTIFQAASSACFDNGDKEIGGSCYKFVAQKLTFADAQYWCHYQNPVTSSYLAYVPNQFTANFLASYGRSAFETDDANFWIGLSRPSPNSQFVWDNGQSLGFSNFGGQLGENYVAESIINAKWNTYGSADTNFFVCSYDPQAPPTFGTPGTTTVGVTPTDEACTRRTGITFFFAYSNEMDSGDLLYVVDKMVIYLQYAALSYTAFANVRFDVRDEEPIQYHSDVASFNQSIFDRFPDSSLSYNDNRGSDVLTVLQKYLDDRTNLCGSLVYVLVGRYPNETDISHLISQLRQNHVFVEFTAKATPSAGNNPKALFDVASATNGYCIFDDDDSHDGFYWTAEKGLNTVFYHYQFLSQSWTVSSSGRVETPVFQTPQLDSLLEIVMVVITLQDSPPVDNVSLNFTISSVKGECVYPSDYEWGQHGTGCIVYCDLNGTTDYTWTIDYSYPNNKPQKIEAQLYSEYYHDFLPLPPI